MVKKILLIVLFCLILLISYYLIFSYKNKKQLLNGQQQVSENSQTIDPLIEPNLTPTNVVQSGNIDYQLNYLIVRPTDIIELYSNLEEKLTGKDAQIKFGCTNLVSAGFYGTDNKHIGLFLSEGKILSESAQNSLFNGYLTIDSNKKSTISATPPADLIALRIALQSGPILFLQGKPVNLNSNVGDPARRIIAAISNRSEITFISIYAKNNLFSGPKLNDLPGIINNINNTTGLNIVDAINLDGGTHSAFLSDSVNINELSTIGGFFCVKPN
jgi:exopolysaccharide biosynthesis protein